VDPGILFLGMALVLVFVMFQRSNRQRREFAQVQAQLSVGAEVMTASGMFGTIVEVSDDRIVLQTGPGQTSTWDRRAVARIVTPSAAPAGRPGQADAEEPGTGAGDEPST
jgi:preprotein translocase subunit YajC